MMQQFEMFNWILITLSFMLKGDVKCSLTITIAVWRFSCHVPGCKLEHNAKMIET